MTQAEKELALKYAPYLLTDRREPFAVHKIGCTVMCESGQSPSFKRRIEIDPATTAFAIEYALAYNYDIQHLYELEHIWVYVGPSGCVRGCEGSWHGKVFNELIPGADILRDGTHVCLYSQPGKHALVPSEQCLYLFPKLFEACGAQAGADGFAYPEWLYGEAISVTDAQREQIREHIQKNYAFVPAMEFEQVSFGAEMFTDWSALRAEIPQWMREELTKILPGETTQ